MPTKYESQDKRARRTPPFLSLADLRFVSGKTLDDICNAIGEELGAPFSRGSLSSIETGRRGASPRVLAALEVAYGLRPGALRTDYAPVERGLEVAS